MTKGEAAKILAILKAAYPSFYKDMTTEEAQGTVSIWSMQFANVSADIVLMALNKAISTSKFPPSIAEVKSKFTSVYWEAYDKLYPMCNIQEQLSDEESKVYKRIYKETEAYKYPAQSEPSIYEMLGGTNNKLLTKG